MIQNLLIVQILIKNHVEPHLMEISFVVYNVNVTVILTNKSYYIFKASKKEKEKVKRLTLDINKRLQEDTWKQAGKY